MQLGFVMLLPVLLRPPSVADFHLSSAAVGLEEFLGGDFRRGNLSRADTS